jgi:hypothetical protein
MECKANLLFGEIFSVSVFEIGGGSIPLSENLTTLRFLHLLDFMIDPIGAIARWVSVDTQDVDMSSWQDRADAGSLAGRQTWLEANQPL